MNKYLIIFNYSQNIIFEYKIIWDIIKNYSSYNKFIDFYTNKKSNILLEFDDYKTLNLIKERLDSFNINFMFISSNPHFDKSQVLKEYSDLINDYKNVKINFDIENKIYEIIYNNSFYLIENEYINNFIGLTILNLKKNPPAGTSVSK